ncbi:anti-sigma factor antagonist [Streptomyces sp. NPDC090088]|uniref:anti-sigma factor antagonist n=1 Tax=Streptomyces sp. NPDC090088 TaxID=3365944 RepID=UPI003819F325
MSLHAALPPDEGPCTECGTAFERAQAPTPVTLNVDANGDRLVVTVRGELDLDSDQQLQQTLSDALDHARGGVELDLAGVDFCDCSALNVLLRVHHRARADAKTLVLRASSPAVERLMALTDTRPLFTAAPRKPDQQPPPTHSDDDLATENAQLHRAMETRATIDLAQGMLMGSFRLTASQSWQVLVAASQHSNTKLHRIADALVQTTNGHDLPEPIADHLASAVKTHIEQPTDRTPARGQGAGER